MLKYDQLIKIRLLIISYILTYKNQVDGTI